MVTLVRAYILEGEVCCGCAAGYPCSPTFRVAVRGVGLARMRDVYEPHELTEACSDDSTCWAAEFLDGVTVPCCYDAADQTGRR